jgi:hypothetical protein
MQAVARELQAQLDEAEAACQKTEQELQTLRVQHEADTVQQVRGGLEHCMMCTLDTGFTNHNNACFSVVCLCMLPMGNFYDHQDDKQSRSSFVVIDALQSRTIAQLKQQLHDLMESQAEDEGQVSTLLGEIRHLQGQQAQLQAEKDQVVVELEQAQCQVCAGGPGSLRIIFNKSRV